MTRRGFLDRSFKVGLGVALSTLVDIPFVMKRALAEGSIGLNGKKLLFMGGEFGQWHEWNHDAGLDWHLLDLPKHDGLRRLVQHLNYIYKNEPALWELDDTYEGFEWIDFHDADNSVVAFL